jgi:hypothetical protein
MNYIIMSLLALLVLGVTMPSIVYASTGMSNCTEEPESDDCNPQPDRVGNDHDEDDEVTRDGPDDDGEENCWGKVTSSLTQNDDGKPGIGEHSSDPRPGDEDNETPREGVGNQDEDHPSDHADSVGGLADEQPDCVD